MWINSTWEVILGPWFSSLALAFNFNWGYICKNKTYSSVVSFIFASIKKLEVNLNQSELIIKYETTSINIFII